MKRVLIPEEERAIVADRIARSTAQRVADDIGICQPTLARIAAGMHVSPGTAAIVKLWSRHKSVVDPVESDDEPAMDGERRRVSARP